MEQENISPQLTHEAKAAGDKSCNGTGNAQAVTLPANLAQPLLPGTNAQLD